MRRIYLDHNARTPLHPDAAAAMSAGLHLLGNPSSVHGEGQQARAALEQARNQVAKALGAQAREVVFTSGATEALHLAIHGARRAAPGRGPPLTVATEHHAVLEEAHSLAATVVGVDGRGVLDREAWERALRRDVPPAVAVVMAANNETGVEVLDLLPALAQTAQSTGTFLVVDAAQAVGKLPLDTLLAHADALALSACKFGGPPGVGALWISHRAQDRWQPVHAGGSQERARRPGTENLLGILGLGAAAAAINLDDMRPVRDLRDHLEARLHALPHPVAIHGDGAPRLANTTFAGFPGVDHELLLLLLDQAGVAASSGSACVSGAHQPSHVLRAMGVSPALCQASVRFSLGRGTTREDVDEALEALAQCLPRARLKRPASASPPR